MFIAGNALEIERREWTAATTVRYPLIGESPSAGSPAGNGMGGRRGEPPLAFIDVGRGLGSPTTSLRSVPIRSPRLPAARLEAKLVERDSGLLADASDAAPRSVRPPAPVVTDSRPILSAASRSQGMMLLSSAVPSAAEPRRLGPAKDPAEAAPAREASADAEATPLAVTQFTVPTGALAVHVVAVVRLPAEDDEAGGSSSAAAPLTDQPGLLNELASIVVLTVLPSRSSKRFRRGGGESSRPHSE